MEIITDKLIQALRFLTSPSSFFISLIFCVVLIFASPVILMTYVFWNFGVSTDEVVIQREQISPNKGFIARYYTISGGGAAGYVSQRVNVQNAMSIFDQSSGIVLELSHSEVPSLEWKSNDLLKISYSKEGTVYSRKARPDNKIPINVEFKEE